MLPAINRNSGGMLPSLVYRLRERQTWGLLCRSCRREVKIDSIGLVEMADDPWTFDVRKTFARAVCRECGGRMWNHRGYQIGGLQFNGWVPTLITSDGSDLWRPALQAAPDLKVSGSKDQGPGRAGGCCGTTRGLPE